MVPRKRIIVLIPNIGIGGQEKMAMLMCKVLMDDYDVQVIAFNHEEKELFCPTSIQFLELPSKRGRIGKALQVLKRVRKYNKLKRDWHPDYTISFGPSANYVNIFSNKIGEKIISFRGHAAIDGSFIMKLSCKRADKVYGISSAMCDEIKATTPSVSNKVFCVYNACDIDEVRKNAKEHDVDIPGGPLIVSMGRLCTAKGFSHLLSAFSLVLDHIPTANLMIIGEGSEMEKLVKKAELLGITEHVFFVGGQTNPFPYLSAGDVCVQTSVSEGFMNVIVEAAACGIPIISTDCKVGPREILTRKVEAKSAEHIEYGDYGVLVPSFLSDDSVEPEKEVMLADAICELLNNEKKYKQYKDMSMECAERFSMSEYKKAIVKVLNAKP